MGHRQMVGQAIIPEGEYKHPFGTLTVRTSERYHIISLRLNEPIGNSSAFEWFWLLDGTFDGTGTELSEGVSCEGEDD